MQIMKSRNHEIKSHDAIQEERKKKKKKGVSLPSDLKCVARRQQKEREREREGDVVDGRADAFEIHLSWSRAWSSSCLVLNSWSPWCLRTLVRS